MSFVTGNICIKIEKQYDVVNICVDVHVYSNYLRITAFIGSADVEKGRIG